MLAPENNLFWQYDPTDWFGPLNSSPQGISDAHATAWLSRHLTGLKKRNPLEKDLILFLSQFRSPLMLLLIGAVLLSAFLGDRSDVFIIVFIVLSTSLLSFFQERNAGRVVEKLQSMISLKCSVIRDGKTITIISDQIVPGDILVIKAGDLIPADCLVLEGMELHANEASITGESYPVKKNTGKIAADTALAKRSNCLWEGSNIVSGKGTALVINTGGNTIFGNIAESITAVKETSFEKGIKDFGFFLMKITLFLSAFILIVNLLNHKSVIESALFALALAVGMAPELLPAITTIAMSAGAKRLLARKVIVKKLAAIQNLGEVSLLCTDKTGTITEGNIKVVGLTDAWGSPSDTVKEYAYWNAVFETGYSNPIDEALKTIAFQSEHQPEKLGEVPYDFIRKRLSIGIRIGAENILVSKGAFSEIRGICSGIRMADGTIEAIEKWDTDIEQHFSDFGKKGFRAIALCHKPLEQGPVTKEAECGMIFDGFILLQDPVKKDITETIEALRQLSVGLKIITGDNRNVAASIAENIGIKEPMVITGKTLLETSPEALPQLVLQAHIFAEVEPQQKESIIRALRKNHTVAYMGDGINDVSAINAADVGISVENAVDVAREAADFVLLEKNLMVLVEGIQEGRKTFANTLKYIFINTGSTFGNMFSVAAASLILPFLPMLPKQILLTNFITDFPYLTVASDNVDPEQMDRPGKWDLKFIRQYMLVFGIHSSLFDIITFLTLLFVLKVKESAFQTGWFIESILTELFILFIIRTHKNFFKSKPGKALLISSMVGLVITIALPYLPFAAPVGLYALPAGNLALLLLIVLLYVLTADLLKVWFFKKYRESTT